METSSFAALHPTYDAERKLLTLSLAHGKANEIGTGELAAFAALCDVLEADDAVMCLCTTSTRTSGSGKPIFISGANVTERSDWDDDRVRRHVIDQRALMARIRKLPLFHIVLVGGITLGWGTEFVLTGDYCIATPQASFGLPETGLGIIPGARGTAELADLVGVAHALRLGCTGEVIDAMAAQRIGLVQEIVDDARCGIVRVNELAEALLKRSPTAVAAYKRALLAGRGVSEAERLELERAAYDLTISTGEAAIGRANFQRVRAGERPPWGPRRH
jgi:enoyl-CoA hydratase/carnithine racemase